LAQRGEAPTAATTTYNIENVPIRGQRQDSNEKEDKERWRARVENWEAVILDFDFHTDNFASTATYFDMEEYLQPEVVEMFKKPRTVHIGNEAHGDLAYKPALLREVARIKRERGLI
jgi:hypothetical protein